jgi:hypothetical protein
LTTNSKKARRIRAAEQKQQGEHMMKDTRFGENNNMERLQLLLSQLVMGLPCGQQIIETFGRFVAQKGETWARAQLASMRDG